LEGAAAGSAEVAAATLREPAAAGELPVGSARVAGATPCEPTGAATIVNEMRLGNKKYCERVLSQMATDTIYHIYDIVSVWPIYIHHKRLTHINININIHIDINILISISIVIFILIFILIL